MNNKSTQKKLPNDGERMVPEHHKGTQIYGEHVARYEAVKDVVKQKEVLDIASGSGYGTEIIAKVAKRVTGVDVSEEAIEYAKQNFSSKNTNYVRGDGENIPCKDDEFEAVVSFETIEHIHNYEKFLKEVKRVLTKDGLLVISTPNEEEYIEDNHFHVHEFKHKELLDLLKKYFKYVTPYYQSTWVTNVIGKENIMTQEGLFNTPTLQTAPIKPSQYLYFYFLCSDRKITEEIQSLNILGQHWSERSIHQNNTTNQRHIEERDKVIKDLKDELKNIAILSSSLQKEIHNIRSTKRWRYTQKIANIKNKILPKP